VGGSCEHGNELTRSIKYWGNFLIAEQLVDFEGLSSVDCRGSNSAVDRGCVYSLLPAGVECVPSTHRVCLVSVRSPVLILDILSEVPSVVPQSPNSNTLNRPRPFYVLSNILFEI
jgi:hypothetical protein